MPLFWHSDNISTVFSEAVPLYCNSTCISEDTDRSTVGPKSATKKYHQESVSRIEKTYVLNSQLFLYLVFMQNCFSIPHTNLHLPGNVFCWGYREGRCLKWSSRVVLETARTLSLNLVLAECVWSYDGSHTRTKPNVALWKFSNDLSACQWACVVLLRRPAASRPKEAAVNM